MDFDIKFLTLFSQPRTLFLHKSRFDASTRPGSPEGRDLRTNCSCRFPPQVLLHQPDVIWSDGDLDADSDYWGSREFLAWLYNDSPVNNTVVPRACHRVCIIVSLQIQRIVWRTISPLSLWLNHLIYIPHVVCPRVIVLWPKVKTEAWLPPRTSSPEELIRKHVRSL